MKNNIKQIQNDITWMRDSCFFHLNKVTEYLTDDQANEDFSDQLSSAQAIYSIDKYERALRCLNLRQHDSDDVEFLRDNLYELFANSNIDFLGRFRQFCDDYFSPSRYEDMIQYIKQSELSALEDSNSLTDSEAREDLADEVCDIVSIRDQINLLSREHTTFMIYVSSLGDSEKKIHQWVRYLKGLDNSINNIFKKYHDLWAIFSSNIKLYREMMIVPADDDEKWWSIVPEITPITIVKEMRMRTNTVSVLTGVVRCNDNIGLFDKWGDLIEETVGAMMNSDPSNAKRMVNLIAAMPNAPQFKHYGQPGFIPPDSTDTETFARVSSILTDVIDDLIRTIEELEKIDDGERNRRLAVAYMVRGKPDKARRILTEE